MKGYIVEIMIIASSEEEAEAKAISMVGDCRLIKEISQVADFDIEESVLD